MAEGGGGYFRGTTADQDMRFSDKNKKLIKVMKFEDILKEKVEPSKIDLEAIKPWVTKKIGDILGMEDDVVSDYVLNQLDEKNLDPRNMQINLTGFLNAKRAREFMGELWSLLIEVQQTGEGTVPKVLEELREEEMKLKKLADEKWREELRQLEDQVYDERRASRASRRTEESSDRPARDFDRNRDSSAVDTRHRDSFDRNRSDFGRNNSSRDFDRNNRDFVDHSRGSERPSRFSSGLAGSDHGNEHHRNGLTSNYQRSEVNSGRRAVIETDFSGKPITKLEIPQENNVDLSEKGKSGTAAAPTDGEDKDQQPIKEREERQRRRRFRSSSPADETSKAREKAPTGRGGLKDSKESRDDEKSNDRTTARSADGTTKQPRLDPADAVTSSRERRDRERDETGRRRDRRSPPSPQERRRYASPPPRERRAPARAARRSPSPPARAARRSPSPPARAARRSPSPPARAARRSPSPPARGARRSPSPPLRRRRYVSPPPPAAQRLQRDRQRSPPRRLVRRSPVPARAERKRDRQSPPGGRERRAREAKKESKESSSESESSSSSDSDSDDEEVVNRGQQRGRALRKRHASSSSSEAGGEWVERQPKKRKQSSSSSGSSSSASED